MSRFLLLRESCVRGREGMDEALTAARMGRGLRAVLGRRDRPRAQPQPLNPDFRVSVHGGGPGRQTSTTRTWILQAWSSESELRRRR